MSLIRSLGSWQAPACACGTVCLKSPPVVSAPCTDCPVTAMSMPAPAHGIVWRQLAHSDLALLYSPCSPRPSQLRLRLPTPTSGSFCAGLAAQNALTKISALRQTSAESPFATALSYPVAHVICCPSYSSWPLSMPTSILPTGKTAHQSTGARLTNVSQAVLVSCRHSSS